MFTQCGLFMLVLFIALSLILYNPQQQTTQEGFDGYYKKYCPSCGTKDKHSCGTCVNCGFCITVDGYGECVPGNNQGPFFRSDCAVWEYGNPYYYGQVYPATITHTSPYRQIRYY